MMAMAGALLMGRPGSRLGEVGWAGVSEVYQVGGTFACAVSLVAGYRAGKDDYLVADLQHGYRVGKLVMKITRCGGNIRIQH